MTATDIAEKVFRKLAGTGPPADALRLVAVPGSAQTRWLLPAGEPEIGVPDGCLLRLTSGRGGTGAQQRRQRREQPLKAGAEGFHAGLPDSFVLPSRLPISLLSSRFSSSASVRENSRSA